MSLKTDLSQTGLMEKYRIALGNAESHPEIAPAMAELGYNQAKIDEGKEIWTNTMQFMGNSKSESIEKKEAHSVFSESMKDLLKIYKLDRKKAKIVFTNEPLVLHELYIDKALPVSHVKAMTNITWFYNRLQQDATLLQKISVMQVNAERVESAKGLIAQVEAARQNYMKENGESQDATRIKDQEFKKIDNWMSQFFAVAHIALEDKPQLLEMLGIVVK